MRQVEVNLLPICYRFALIASLCNVNIFNFKQTNLSTHRDFIGARKKRKLCKPTVFIYKNFKKLKKNHTISRRRSFF